MSFFIKGKVADKISRSQSKGKFSKDKQRKRKAPSKPQRKNEEITSSEDEVDDLDGRNGDFNDDEEEYPETAQEKKLRLAKHYLKEIERVEKEKYGDKLDDENFKNDVIESRLKEDYLKQSGRLRLIVAEKYIGADCGNIRVLKCKEHKNCPTVLCVTSDDRYVFSGSKGGNLVKWSLTEYKKVGSIGFVKKNSVSIRPGHGSDILSMAISTDGKYLAVGDESSDIQIWNPEDLTHISTLKNHRGPVTGLVFRKDTHTLYSASKDRSVKVWSLDEMSYIETLYGHLDGITSIDALLSERAVTSGGNDATLRVWKIAEESQLIYNSQGGSTDCVKLINEINFVSGSDDGQLKVWGVNKKKPLCTVTEAHGTDPINGQAHWICSLATYVNTDLIASGSSNGTIKFWQLKDTCTDIKFLFEVPCIGFVNSMSFTHDGKYLIAAVGVEHKLGRWTVLKSAKNSIVVIPLNLK